MQLNTGCYKKLTVNKFAPEIIKLFFGCDCTLVNCVRFIYFISQLPLGNINFIRVTLMSFYCLWFSLGSDKVT
jgi:hypothetical protein